MKLLVGQAARPEIYLIDPRTKLFWLAGNLIVAIACHGVATLSVLVAMILITSLMAGIRPGYIIPLLKIMAVIGTQFILLQGLLRQQGPVLIEFGFIKLYGDGVRIGIEGMLVLLILTLLSVQFFLWSTPEDLTLLMVKLGFPHKYAVLVGLTLRFIPVLEKDLANIKEGQQTRGMELLTIGQKVKGLFSIALPLLLRTLKRTGDVALYMELKGYTLHRRRTFLRTLQWRRIDFVCLAGGALYFGILASWKLQLP